MDLTSGANSHHHLLRRYAAIFLVLNTVDTLLSWTTPLQVITKPHADTSCLVACMNTEPHFEVLIHSIYLFTQF